MSFLLDTCAISELIKKKPNPGFINWISGQEEYNIYLSVITIGEIVKGISKLTDLSKKSYLQKWVDQQLVKRFQHRLLPVNTEVSEKWGELLGASEQIGLKLPVIDALIASTAQLYNLTVVTRNVLDFEKCKATILNPWSE